MTIGIKTNAFDTSKLKEKSWEADGVGWNPAYMAKTEGVGRSGDRIKYGKGHSFMAGTCKNCTNNNGTKKPGGGHCDLPDNVGCIF